MMYIKIFILLMTSFQLFSGEWSLNTGNKNKLKEYQKFFQKKGETLLSSDIDLREIDADPISVVVQKASQMDDKILVEDTSLDIDGENVGVNIKWLLDDLDRYTGKKATWTVLLAYKENGNVFVFQGQVNGTIVSSKGNNGFGFDPYFLPTGSQKTLAEDKPERYNARFLATQALFKNKPKTVEKPIENWKGPWQEN